MSLCSVEPAQLHVGAPGRTNRSPREWQSSQAQHRGPGNRPTWVSANMDSSLRSCRSLGAGSPKACEFLVEGPGQGSDVDKAE